MPSALGLVASHAMEHWLFPLWLRPAEQASEARELDAELILQPLHDSRLVTDRESVQPRSDILGS